MRAVFCSQVILLVCPYPRVRAVMACTITSHGIAQRDRRTFFNPKFMCNTNQKGSGEPQTSTNDAVIKSDADNFTTKNPAMSDPYDVLLKIKYDQIRRHQILIDRSQELVSRSQELVSREQELVRSNQELIMWNQERFDKLLSIIEKRLGIV